MPLKKRKGAFRWNPRSRSIVSESVRIWALSSSHSCAHELAVSELSPCSARPLWHAPRLMLMTDCQSQFLTKAARACSGEPTPPPPRGCPPPSGARAGPVSASSLHISPVRAFTQAACESSVSHSTAPTPALLRSRTPPPPAFRALLLKASVLDRGSCANIETAADQGRLSPPVSQ